MAEVSQLPTENFTILCIAAFICAILAFVCYKAYNRDSDELFTVTDVIYFQQNIPLRDPVYIVTLKVEDCYAYSGWTDLILRLRGSRKDSPLILFRDYDGQYLSQEKILNIGFSVPFDLGSLMEINVAADNSDFDEGAAVLSFSDLFIRKLPRKADALANSRTRMLLKEGESPFDALSKNVRTWASTETLTTAKGVNVLGVSSPTVGRSYTVRARDVAVGLHLEEEAPTVKKQNLNGFRPLHYIWSQGESWHEPWSEYSHLDHEMVICLDLLATLVAVASCYAYGIDRFIGVRAVAEMLESSIGSAIERAPVLSIEKFDIMDFFTNFQSYLICLILIVYMGLVGSTFVIPLSLIWCRLFRLIGGKGFEKALEDAQPPPPSVGRKSKMSMPRASAKHGDLYDDEFGDGSCLMLRTLECKSTHTASCVTSSRRLRMEPLLSNCPADHITARSIAYIRTKMTKLRDDSILSGHIGIKHPDVLHESHTQSTDAPQMPPPTSAPDGSGDVVRISRYCERLVQQAVRQIHDNSVIAECFEVAPHVEAINENVPGKKRDKFEKCCPKRCCGMKGDPNESISNLTFFTEEDAISLQEMVDHLPASSSNRKLTPRPPARAATTKDIILKDLGDESYYEPEASVPLPSAETSRKSGKVGKLSFKTIKEKVAKKAYEAPTARQSIKIKGVRTLPPPKEKGKDGLRLKGVRFDVGLKELDIPSETRENLPKKEKGEKSGKTVKKSKQRTSGSWKQVPTPSGRSDIFYDAVPEQLKSDDWASAKSQFSEGPDRDELARSAPFKGFKVKLGVFACLLLLQLGEIYFVTAFEMEENKFFLRNINGSPGPGAGRLNAALLSCIVAILWYPLFTVHIIALLSSLIEYFRLQLGNNDDEPYDDNATVTSSRNSLAALP